MDGVGAVDDGLPEGFEEPPPTSPRRGGFRRSVFPISFHLDGIKIHQLGNDGSGVVAHHAAAVAGAGPLGQEATLQIDVGQSLEHLLPHRRIEQVDQREQRAERVPETCVGEHIARQHLTVVGAVVDGIASGIVFVEHTGKERGAVEAGVERAQMVDVVVLNLDAAQHIVPTLATLLLDGLERRTAHLLQIALGLLGRDERRRHAHYHLLAFLRLEAHHGLHVVALGLAAMESISILLDAVEVELLVELHDEVVAEVLRHTAAVARGVAGDGATVHIVLDGRTLVEGIDDDAGDAFFRHARLREREAHDARPLRGSYLSPHVVVGQIYLIIIWTRLLGVVGEPRGTLLLVVDQVGGRRRHLVELRHDGELAVVVDPGRGLVGLLEAPNLVLRVDILPAVAHLACLRHPEVHAPRHGDGGIGVARGEGEGRHRAHERADIVDGSAGS